MINEKYISYLLGLQFIAVITIASGMLLYNETLMIAGLAGILISDLLVVITVMYP